MGPVEEGVSNFRIFTGTVTDFQEFVRAQFSAIEARDHAKIQETKAVAIALKERDEKEEKEKAAREEKADRWWNRLDRKTAIIAAMLGMWVALWNLAGPTVRHWLHVHGFNILETYSDAPTATSYTLPNSKPQEAENPPLEGKK